MDIKVATSDLMSVAQAASELGRPRSTIYRWVDASKIVSIKLGGVLFIPASEIGRLNAIRLGVEALKENNKQASGNLGNPEA